jgi:hypothetical protein
MAYNTPGAPWPDGLVSRAPAQMCIQAASRNAAVHTMIVMLAVRAQLQAARGVESVPVSARTSSNGVASAAPMSISFVPVGCAPCCLLRSLPRSNPAGTCREGARGR